MGIVVTEKRKQAEFHYRRKLSDNHYLKEASVAQDLTDIFVMVNTDLMINMNIVSQLAHMAGIFLIIDFVCIRM